MRTSTKAETPATTLTLTDNTRAAIGTVLEFKWTVSRGADTYGYNICSLRDRFGKLLGRCSGGGYDMKGTALGNWITKAFQPELIALAQAPGTFDVYNADTSRFEHVPTDSSYHSSGAKFYGAHACVKGGKVDHVTLDGACGFSSMQAILRAIGLDLRWLHETKRTDLYEVVEAKREVAQ